MRNSSIYRSTLSDEKVAFLSELKNQKEYNVQEDNAPRAYRRTGRQKELDLLWQNFKINPKEEKSSSKNKDVKREIINYLNQKIGSDYRSTTKATVQLINARLKEGFNLEDFKKVIDNQYDKWFGTDMAQYLRPQTLFGTKFENYLNTPVKQKETSIERQDEDVYEILDMSEEEYWRSKRNNQ